MSVENKRYDISGFPFGNHGYFNLTIRTKSGEYGYTTEYSIELTPEERQELITVLIRATTKDGEE